MNDYVITVSRFGFATIEAKSKEDAYQKAEAMGSDDFDWSWDFEVTDCENLEDI